MIGAAHNACISDVQPKASYTLAARANATTVDSRTSAPRPKGNRDPLAAPPGHLTLPLFRGSDYAFRPSHRDPDDMHSPSMRRILLSTLFQVYPHHSAVVLNHSYN